MAQSKKKKVTKEQRELLKFAIGGTGKPVLQTFGKETEETRYRKAYEERNKEKARQTINNAVAKKQMREAAGAHSSEKLKPSAPRATRTYVENGGKRVSTLEQAKQLNQAMMSDHTMLREAAKPIEYSARSTFGSMPATAKMAANALITETTGKNTSAYKAAEAREIEIAAREKARQEALAKQYGVQNFDPGQRLVSDVSSGVFGMIPYLGASALNPILGVGTLMGQVYGQATNSALADGAAAPDARRYGFYSMATEGAPELLFRFPGTPGLINAGKTAGKVLGKAASNPVVRAAGNVLGTAAGEAVEEGLTAILDPYAKRASYDPMAPNATPEEIAYQGLIGGLSSVILQGGNAALRKGINTALSNDVDTAQKTEVKPQQARLPQPEQVPAQQIPQPQNEIMQQPVPPVQQVPPMPALQQQPADQRAIKLQPRPLQKASDVAARSNVSIPMEQRDWDNVKDKGVKAYQQENPAVKPIYQETAERLLSDMQYGERGRREVGIDPETRTVTRMEGIKRSQSQPVEAMLKDGMTYKQIEDGLQRIIEDNGKENTTTAKRVELYVDEAARRGYNSIEVGRVSPDHRLAYAGMTREQLQAEMARLDGMFGEPGVDPQEIVSRMVAVNELLQEEIRKDTLTPQLQQPVEQTQVKLKPRPLQRAVEQAPIADAEPQPVKAALPTAEQTIENQRNAQAANEMRLKPADMTRVKPEILEWKKSIESENGTVGGMQVVLVENLTKPNGEPANGMYQDGKVYLDVNRLSEVPVMRYVTGHELFHGIKGTREHMEILDEYVKYQQSMNPEIGIEDMIAAKLEEYEGIIDPNDPRAREKAMDELGAEFMELIFTEPGVVREINAKKPNLFRRIMDAIKGMLDRLTGKDNLTALERQQKAMLEQGYRKFNQALQKQAERGQKPGKGEGSMYSASDIADTETRHGQLQQKYNNSNFDIEKLQDGRYNYRSKFNGKTAIYTEEAHQAKQAALRVYDAQQDSKAVIDTALEAYKPLQQGVANEKNFFFNTVAKFGAVKSRPRREPDHISYTWKPGGKRVKSSEYWYTKDGVVRGSDHWGTGIASCDWALINPDGSGVYGNSGEVSKTSKKYGYAKWSDFVHKTDIVDIEGEQITTNFDNSIDKDTYWHNGNAYTKIGREYVKVQEDDMYSSGNAANTADRHSQLQGKYKNAKPKHKVYTNTFANSNFLSQAEANLLMCNEKLTERDVVTEKESLARAAARVDADFEGEYERLRENRNYSGEDLDAAMMILHRKLQNVEGKGNYKEVMLLGKNIAENGKEGGRMIQSFAKYSRNTKEGIVINGIKTAMDVENAMTETDTSGKKRTGKKGRKLQKELKEVDKAVDAAEKQAEEAATIVLEQAVQKRKRQRKSKEGQPEVRQDSQEEYGEQAERLARKASDRVDPPEPEQGIPENEISDELYRVLEEAGVPDLRVKGEKATTVEKLRYAYENKYQYIKAWNGAKEILQKKYDGNKDVYESLQAFFDAGIVPNYSKQTVKKAVRETAKDLGFNLGDLAAEYKEEKARAREVIAAYITRNMGPTLSNADIAEITDQVMKAYNDTLAEATEKRLRQMFTTKAPTVKSKNQLDRVLELINLGVFDREEYKNLVKEKYGIPVLTGKDIEQINRFVDEANKHRQYSYDWNMNMQKAWQVVAKKQPETFTKAMINLKRISMLSNLATMERNFIGNIPMAATEMVGNTLVAPLDAATTKLRNNIDRRHGGQGDYMRNFSANPLAQIPPAVKGFGKGLKETAKDIRHGVNTYRMGEDTLGQYEMPRGNTFGNKEGWGPFATLDKVLGAFERFVNYGLMFGDRPFFEAHHAARMNELERLGYDVTSDEVQAASYAHAVEMVYQNDSPMSKGAQDIRRGLNQLTEEFGLPLGDFVTPFVQTPANIADKIIDMSPVALIKMVRRMGSDAKQGKPFDQEAFFRSAGRMMTGSALMALGAALMHHGIITGGAPEDKEEKAALYASGWRPYSFVIGDKYFSYEFIQPPGTLMAIGADMYQTYRSTEALDMLSMVKKGTLAGVNCFFHMSFLESFLNFFGGYGDIGENLAYGFQEFPLQFVPALGGAIARTLDEDQRETYDPNPAKNLGNKIQAKLPKAGEELPAKLDMYGRELKQNQGRGTISRFVENVLIPSRMTTTEHDTVNDALLELKNKTGSTSQFFALPDKKVDFGNEKVQLTAQEYLDFNKNSNGRAAAEVERFIKSSYYKELTDYQKIDVINEIKKYYKNDTKEKLAAKKHISWQGEEYKQLKESGDRPYKFFAEKELMQQSGLSTRDYQKTKALMADLDRMKMQYDSYVEVKKGFDDIRGRVVNGVKDKTQTAKIRRYNYLNQQLQNGNISKEGWWYIWSGTYNAPNRPKDGSPYWRDCKYQWIVDKRTKELEAEAQRNYNVE